MGFNKKVPLWEAMGVEPPDDLKKTGFQAGYKPPADFFNWFWYGVSAALVELQGMKPSDIGAVPQERTINGKSLSANFNLAHNDVGAIGKNAVELAATADMDTLIDVGMYTYSAAAATTIKNAPAATQGTLLVLPRLTNTAYGNRIQVVFSQNENIYMRNMVDNTWNAWKRMRKADEIIPIEFGGTGAVTAANALQTLGAAPQSHGRHVTDVCATITDWDNATANGWYMGNNAVNGPTVQEAGSNWYFGHVIAHNANYVLQEVYQFTASSDAKYIPKYIRVKKDGTWGAWVDVTVQVKVPVNAILDGANKDLSNVTDEVIKTRISGIITSKTIGPYAVELSPPEGSANGGFIDFHFAGDYTVDYTTRIIEESKGILNVVGGLKVNNQSVFHAGSIIQVANGGTGANNAAQALRNLGIIYSETEPAYQAGAIWLKPVD